MEPLQGELWTQETLQEQFEKLGVASGMTVLMHSSMKAIGGFVAGGPVAVIYAMETCLGDGGTLVMPTHTGDLSDPENWRNPPVNESWWEPIRKAMPAFSADLTPCFNMGIINECFRKQSGVVRSDHPQVSFAAWGAKKDSMTANHSLAYCLSEQSPIARLYGEEGWILLLGVGHDRNTTLHLAEYRAQYAGKAKMINKAPISIEGKREWAAFADIDFSSDDFERLGQAFERETGLVRRGKVGHAEAQLMPAKPLVDFAVQWMESHRI